MRKYFKKISLILIAAMIIMAIGACGSSTSNDIADSSDDGTQETEAVVENTGEIYELTLGSFPGDNLTQMEEFAADVLEASNGQLVIEVVNFLTLGSTSDAVQMAKDGSLDFILISGTEYVGYEPCSAVVAVPGVVDNISDAVALEKALYEAGYFSDWDGEIISILTTDMQYIALVDDYIESADDFKGLVGRCQNANGITLLENLGSSITTISTSEVYMSLETGIIDFSVSSPTNMTDSAYAEVVDYIIDYTLYCDCNCLVMNNDSYAALPDDLKEILKECGESLTDSYTEWNIEAEAEGIQDLKDGGVEFIECPEDVITIFEESSDACMESFLDTLASAGVDTDTFSAFVDEIRADLGY